MYVYIHPDLGGMTMNEIITSMTHILWRQMLHLSMHSTLTCVHFVFDHLELHKIVSVNFDGALEHSGLHHMVTRKRYSARIAKVWVCSCCDAGTHRPIAVLYVVISVFLPYSMVTLCVCDNWKTSCTFCNDFGHKILFYIACSSSTCIIFFMIYKSVLYL